MKTLIVGIGPARCMTTFFTRELAKNINIFIPGRKEVNLLHKDPFDMNNYKKIIFSSNRGIVIDYTNNYSLSIKNVKKNISKIQESMDIKVKFLFLYRDPVKRFISHLELLSDRSNLCYDELGHDLILSCMKQSIYSKMLSEIDKDTTFVYDMDKALKNINQFSEEVSNFLEIEKHNFDISRKIGDSKKIRFYFIEKIRQKTFIFLEKNNLDWLINFIRNLKLIKLLKYINSYDDRKSIKFKIEEFYKNEINIIKNDEAEFNKIIKTYQ